MYIYVCVCVSICILLCIYYCGRKNSLVPVPRPCVSSRMEEHATPLSYTPRLRSLSTLAVAVHSYTIDVPSSEPAFYSGSVARKTDAIASRVSFFRRDSLPVSSLVVRYISLFYECTWCRRNGDRTGGNTSCEIRIRSFHSRRWQAIIVLEPTFGDEDVGIWMTRSLNVSLATQLYPVYTIESFDNFLSKGPQSLH